VLRAGKVVETPTIIESAAVFDSYFERDNGRFWIGRERFRNSHGAVGEFAGVRVFGIGIGTDVNVLGYISMAAPLSNENPFAVIRRAGERIVTAEHRCGFCRFG